MRLASFHGLVWTHGGIQVFGYIVFTVAAGLGVFIANGAAYLTEPHAVIGMALLAVLFFMPFVGVIHHRVYQRVQKRSFWSYAHIFAGRAGILLGMVNAGLGMQLASASTSSMVAYGVVAGVMGTLYLGVVVFGEVRHSKKHRPGGGVASGVHAESKRHPRDDSGSDAS